MTALCFDVLLGHPLVFVRICEDSIDISDEHDPITTMLSCGFFFFHSWASGTDVKIHLYPPWTYTVITSLSRGQWPVTSHRA